MQVFKEMNKGSESEKEVTIERLQKGRYRNVRDTARAKFRPMNLLLMPSQENVENYMGDFKGQPWKWRTSLPSYTTDQESST